MDNLTEEQKAQLEKVAEFLSKSEVHSNLPIFEELKELNQNLRKILEKPLPEFPTPLEKMKVEIEGIEVLTLKGDVGEMGEQGIQGDNGKDGKNGKDGRDGRDGRDGLDGKDGTDGKEGLHGKDGSPDLGEQIIEKINNDESEKQIKAEKVEGLEDKFLEVSKQISSIPRGGGGSGRGVQLYVSSIKKGLAQYVNLIAGSNMTISDSLVNGLHSLTFTASGSSGTVVSEEIPSGTINGSNNTFTLAHTPIAGTLHLFLNGSRRQQESGVNINDFNLTGTTITFDVAPRTNSILFADYSY